MIEKITFHLLGLGHQPVSNAVTHCVFTMKVYNMCQMIKKSGHEVILYGAGSLSPFNDITYVQCVTDIDMIRLLRHKFRETFNQGHQSSLHELREIFNPIAKKNILRNLKGRDVVLASYGNWHEAACPSNDSALVVEMGIGYEGIFAKHKIWESYTWKHYMYGTRNLKNNPESGFENDAVIPNYIDPSMFNVSFQNDGYLLFLGRVILSKGIMWAYEAAMRTGHRFVIAGEVEDSCFQNNLPGAEFIGTVGVKARAE